MSLDKFYAVSKRECTVSKMGKTEIANAVKGGFDLDNIELFPQTDEGREEAYVASERWRSINAITAALPHVTYDTLKAISKLLREPGARSA